MKERADNAWLSIGAYARTWGLTRQTVYKLLEANLLEHYRTPDLLLIVRIRNVRPDQHQPVDRSSTSSGVHPCL